MRWLVVWLGTLGFVLSACGEVPDGRAGRVTQPAVTDDTRATEHTRATDDAREPDRDLDTDSAAGPDPGGTGSWTPGPNALNQDKLFQCNAGALLSSPSRVRRLERREWTHHVGKPIAGTWWGSVARDNPLDAPAHHPYSTYARDVTLDVATLDLYFSVLHEAGSNWTDKYIPPDGIRSYTPNMDSDLKCIFHSKTLGDHEPSDECVDYFVDTYLRQAVLFRPPSADEFSRLRAFLVEQLALEDPPLCGDRVCNGDEGTASCPKDCGNRCGDGKCNGDEVAASCPGDCKPGCGDAVCNGTETYKSCTTDCGSRCGDGACANDESVKDCRWDCQINTTERRRTLRRTTSAAWLMASALFKTELGDPEDDAPSDGRDRLTDHELARALGGVLSTRAPGGTGIFVGANGPPDHPGWTAPAEGYLAGIAAAAADGSIQDPGVMAELLSQYGGGTDPMRYDLLLESRRDQREARGEFWLPPRIADFFREWLDYAHLKTVYKDQPGATSQWTTGSYDGNSVFNPITLAYNNLLLGELGLEATLEQHLDDTIARVLIEDTDVLKNLLTTRLWRAASNVGNTNHQRCTTDADCTDSTYKVCTTIKLCGSSGSKSTVEVHRIYNRAKDIEDTPEGRWIALPEAERAGVLTHPAWLAAHGGNFEDDPSLIHRGKWIRENLFCQVVPPLELVMVDAKVGPSAPEKTARDRVVEAIETGPDSGTCMGCHAMMNSLGYPFEIYNHAGYVRTEDHGKAPNGTTHIVNAPDPALNATYQDAVEFSHALSESSDVKRCFIRQAFRFFMGRDETGDDACTLAAMETAYDPKGSFDDMLVALVTSDSFLYRHHETP